MKKVINRQEDIIEEMIEGFLCVNEDLYEKLDRGVVLKEKKDKVGILTGGGSGHEPLFLGFVGNGLADGAALGNVFAAPTPYNILEVIESVDSGKGVIQIYGNYAGDVLNFDMAAELAEMEGIECKSILVRDDVASAPLSRYEDRRGIAGDVFVIKLAGAAADEGLSIDEVARISQKAADNTRSIGVALSSATIPGLEKPTFTLAEDEIEFGMGIHGEPGIKRTKMMKADDLTTQMMETLFNDYPYKKGDEVSVLVNGLGSTTQMELLIVNRKVNQMLKEKGITIHHNDVNNYCTSQEMGGLSISLLLLDDELKALYDKPAYSPYYVKNA